MEGSVVRSVSLGLYVGASIFIVWFWWSAVHVERHPLPNVCDLTQSQGLWSDPATAKSERSFSVIRLDGDSSTADSFGGCKSSPSLKARASLPSADAYVRSLLCTEYRDPGSVRSVPQVWTTSVFIVPQCQAALQEARRVYAHLLELGGASSSHGSETCVAISVSSLLAALSSSSALPENAANRVLTVRLLEDPLDGGSCTSFKTFSVANSQESLDEMEALHALTVVVSVVEQNSSAVSVHLAENSKIFLEVLGLSEDSKPSLSSQAVVQVLGRLLLTPEKPALRFSDAHWLLRFWLLGDSLDEADARLASEKKNWDLTDSERRNCSFKGRWHDCWSVADLVDTHMASFLRKLSVLVDLTVESQTGRRGAVRVLQAVPESGVWSLPWNDVVFASRETEKTRNTRAVEAMMEETARRLTVLTHKWGTPRVSFTRPSHVSPRVVNLGLYAPQLAAFEGAEKKSFYLPDWGFLTFQTPLSPNVASGSDAEAGEGSTQQKARHLQRAEEVTATWKLQMRSEFGLLPQVFGNALERSSLQLSEKERKDKQWCDGACVLYRQSQWRLRLVETKSPTPLLAHLPSDSQDPSSALSSNKRFALAMLEATSHRKRRTIAVYRHLGTSGVADWEIASVAVKTFSDMLKQTIENLASFTRIASSSREICLPERVGTAFQHIVDLLSCSIEALHFRMCRHPLKSRVESLIKSFFSSKASDAAASLSGKREDLEKRTAFRLASLLMARAAFAESNEVGLECAFREEGFPLY